VVAHHLERTLEDEPFVVLEARHVRVWVLLQHKVAQFGRLERNESRGSPLGFVQVPMRRTHSSLCCVRVCVRVKASQRVWASGVTQETHINKCCHRQTVASGLSTHTHPSFNTSHPRVSAGPFVGRRVRVVGLDTGAFAGAGFDGDDPDDRGGGGFGGGRRAPGCDPDVSERGGPVLTPEPVRACRKGTAAPSRLATAGAAAAALVPGLKDPPLTTRPQIDLVRNLMATRSQAAIE
jgi:hypothetical protein